MKFCKKCGKQVPAGQACDCGAGQSPAHSIPQPVPRHASPIPPRAASSIPPRAASARPTAPMPASPSFQNTGNPSMQTLDGIALTDKEVVVRSYRCSQLIFPKSVCNLTVTNRRVIYHGRTNDGRIVDSVPLESVSAISAFYGKTVGKSSLIAGIALLIIGLALMVMADDVVGVLFGLLPLLGGGALIYFAFQEKAFSLQVYASNVSECPISISSPGALSAAGKMAIINFMARPTEETDAMLCELSAMIIDLQSLGDYGISIWQS